MKFLLLSLLITFACAEFDLKQVESGQFFVPKDPKAFLESYKTRGVVEKTRDGRIANGMNAAEGQFPYALRVSVFDTDGAIFICSGALIAPNFLLTVRHCFDPRLTFSVMAAVGSVNLNSADMVERFSDNWWFAPPISGWNPDLAVVRLSTPFPTTSRIQPIRLPSNSQRNYEFAQYPISVIGWGTLKNNSYYII
jgi:secreted trypsin-like serine protease